MNYIGKSLMLSGGVYLKLINYLNNVHVVCLTKQKKNVKLTNIRKCAAAEDDEKSHLLNTVTKCVIRYIDRRKGPLKLLPYYNTLTQTHYTHRKPVNFYESKVTSKSCCRRWTHMREIQFN
jgi:hypothetical protein